MPPFPQSVLYTFLSAWEILDSHRPPPSAPGPTSDCQGPVYSSRSSSNIFPGNFVLFSIIALTPLYFHLSVCQTLSCLIPPHWLYFCLQGRAETVLRFVYTVLPNRAAGKQRKRPCWLYELEFVCVLGFDKAILHILSKTNKSNYKTTIWWEAQLFCLTRIDYCTYYCKSIKIMCFYES